MSPEFYCKAIVTIIATGLVTSILSTSNFEDNLTFVILSVGQLLQHSPEEFQSTTNKQLRQTVTDTVNDMDRSNNLDFTQTNYSQTQNRNSSSLIQEKGLVIDKMPLQKIKVGDIDIAYKEIGHGPQILLISGSSKVMDV